MENFWNFLLIISSLYYSVQSVRECVMLENWDLEIPDNPVVSGSKKAPWYREIDWETPPDQDDPPTLSYKMDNWVENSYGGGDWVENRSGSTSLCNSDVETEKGSMADLGRSAMGLSKDCTPIENSIATSRSLFSRFDDCHVIYFDGPLMENNKKGIYLDVDDSNGNKLLQGKMIIPVGGRVHT